MSFPGRDNPRPRRKGRAQILASPHMVASNGREAHILIGDKVPVQTEHLSGKETAVSTTYEEAGIKIDLYSADPSR